MARRRSTTDGSHTLLPLRRRRLSHTISCWYCDFKMSVFNDFLFILGRKNARFLRVWFAVGVGFSFTAFIGATLILFCELAGVLHLYSGTFAHRNLPTSTLFGLFPLISGLSISITDTGYLIFSTLISVVVHEFGHAIAATSEGVNIEYIAIFLAILFPGALVAFNYEMLKNLPRPAELRVYCAGIWHNAVCCAACSMTLFFLPLILYPLYTHAENPMVLSVNQASPLSDYLSSGDLILSLDGSRIHDSQEWMEKMSRMGDGTLQEYGDSVGSQSSWESSGGKGYCLPNVWVEDSRKVLPIDDRFTCPDELTAFNSVSCFNSSLSNGTANEVSQMGNTSSTYCFPAKEVVKRKKCGSGWQTVGTNGRNCPCIQNESCFTPVPLPGLTWVEITFSRPYSSGCLQLREKSSEDFGSLEYGENNCGGSFVFVGDVLSEVYSVQLTSYRPRWAFIFGFYLPTMMEKMLNYTFQVSTTLVLLNSLPVFFLDGESILEVTLCYATWLSPGRRRQVFKFCLVGGSLLSVLALSRFFLSIVSYS